MLSSFSHFRTVVNLALCDIFCFELGCYFSIILVLLYHTYIKTAMGFLLSCVKIQIECAYDLH